VQVTFNPVSCNNFATEEATIPFPRPDITPPVMNMNFGNLLLALLVLYRTLDFVYSPF